MNPTLIDLALFWGATFGLSWGVSKSTLLNRPRAMASGVPFFGKMIQCIVCTSYWVGCAMALIAPYSNIFTIGITGASMLSRLILVMLGVTATWVVANIVGRYKDIP